MHFSAMYRMHWYRKAFLSWGASNNGNNKPCTHGCRALIWR